MKAFNANKEALTRPVRILYHFNSEVFMRSDNEMGGKNERFDKNSLSEVDMDEIMAIACGELY